MKENSWNDIGHAATQAGEEEDYEIKKKQEQRGQEMKDYVYNRQHYFGGDKQNLDQSDNDVQCDTSSKDESIPFHDEHLETDYARDQRDALKALERCLLTKRAAIERQKQLVEQVSRTDQSSPEQVKMKRQKSHQENKLKNQQLMRGRQPQWRKDDKEVNLSFCGCGFLGIYHVGVASCFHQYAPQLSMQKISGSSAGALIAMAHICGDLQLAYCTTDILTIAIEARSHTLGSFHPSFDIQAQVRESLDRGLPEDAYLKANGKLHVSLTRVEDGENVIINEFDSNEDLIQVLLCSCFIPFWSGISLPKYRGVAYIDGGFTNNLLILDEKTVTVSPFAGEADICPQDDTLNLLQVNLSNTSFSISPSNLYRLSHALLPPEPEILSDLCKQGFADGIRYLQRMNLISCTKCLEIRSSLLVTADGEDMEEIFSGAASQKSTSVHVSANHRHEREQASIPSIKTHIDANEQTLQPHIILEQQEQETIEITENASRSRRPSVVSINLNWPHHSASRHSGQQQPIATINDGSSNGTSAVALYNLLNGIDDDGAGIDDDCNECVLIRQRALYDPLPKQFRDRIREASDKVNKSLSKWIYSHRPVKYLSYLMVPYYVPIDLTLAMIYRFWKKMPIIRKEVSDCVNRVLDFLITIMKSMQSRSTTAMLMGFGSSWEEDVLAYEKELIKQKQEARVHYHHHHHHHHHTTNGPAEQRPRASSSVPLSSSSHHYNHNQLQQHHKELHSLEDTFDSIVDVTSKQEARIFAYYFRDAKNRLQVTEIFDLEKAAT